MKKLSVNSRLKALEKTIVGAYVSEIDFRFGYCLKIVVTKPDDDVNPKSLRELELTFSNVGDCSVNFAARPSLEISKGVSCASKSPLLDARNKRLKKAKIETIRPDLYHFKLAFDGGSCNFLARDFALCVLSETPRATVRKATGKNP